MTRRAPLLAARGVSRRFGRRTALAPTDLELFAGEAVALVGPNGAGKSTLLSLLAGAIAPTEGSVDWGEGVRVGWAPQRPAHYGRLSARENLEFFARLGDEASPAPAAERLLGDFELPGDSQPSASLSVGNRQRLNLATAMLGDPNVLLLDEPTAALDARQRRRFWDAATRLKEHGGALVFATQLDEEIERFADRVAVLLGGSVAFEGTSDEYLRRHADPLFA